MNKSSNYPPGVSKRLVDWVKFDESTTLTCSSPGCTSTASRETDAGSLCLVCYMTLPTCIHVGCHRPALELCKSSANLIKGDEAEKKRRKSWIPKCRDHYYDPEIEKAYLDDQRTRLQQGSSYSNGATY